jgi:hypothetical protein
MMEKLLWQADRFVGRPIQAADPLSSGSSRLKAGCGQDCPPYKLVMLL